MSTELEVARAASLLAEAVSCMTGYEPRVMHFETACPANDGGAHAIVEYEVADSATLFEVGDEVLWAEMGHHDYRGISAWIDFIHSTAQIDFPAGLDVRISVAGRSPHDYTFD